MILIIVPYTRSRLSTQMIPISWVALLVARNDGWIRNDTNWKSEDGGLWLRMYPKWLNVDHITILWSSEPLPSLRSDVISRKLLQEAAGTLANILFTPTDPDISVP